VYSTEWEDFKLQQWRIRITRESGEMRFIRIGVVMSFGVIAMVFPKFAYARNTADIERRLEELTRTVTELQKIVVQQNTQLKEQRVLIDELKQQLKPEAPAALLEPHLDKHLLHDLSGVGEQLGDLRIEVGLTGVVQGSLGAQDIDGEDNDSIDGTWSLDLEFESPIGQRGLAFVLVEAGEGESLSNDLFLYQNVNDSAEDTGGNFEVSEAWYQHYFVSERLYLAAGKLDMSNYFDNNVAANDEEFQFLNSALVNSTAIAFPENGPGAILGWIPNNWLELSAGWAKSDAQWEDLDQNVFGIAQVNFRPMMFELPGNYRFLAWTGEPEEEEFEFDDASDRGWGAGVSFDQMFSRSIIGFFRFAYADEDVYPVGASWSAGAQIFGYAWGREQDFLGLAVAQALISDEVEPDDPETLVEAYYSFAVNRHFFLSPDLQIISNPGGNEEADTVVVLGTRAQLDF
jgi:hypothetical protein